MRCKVLLWGILSAALALAAHGQPVPATPAPPRPDRYVDAVLPGSAARLFAAGVVSMPRGEGDYPERPVFSPDLRECYFDVNNYKNKTSTAFSMRYQDGKWSRPEPAFFASQGGFQASLGADGRRLFFTAPSPHDAKVRGIWLAERMPEGWSKTAFLGPPVNAGSNVGFPCATRRGALYFFRWTKDGEATRGGVFRAQPTSGGRYESAESLPPFQSTAAVSVGDFYVAPDESYLIIYSTLPDNLGSGDLYVSFRRRDDTWTPLRNLGAAVNTPGYDFAPSVSPDGRFIFFTRDRGDKQGDVYWIGSQILDNDRRQ